MNRLEAWVYDKVAAYPNLRIPIVDAYQKVCVFMPMKTSIVGAGLQIFPGLFFGFHFHSPWNQDGRYLLAHRFFNDVPEDIAERLPLEVGVIQEEKNSLFTPLATTRAWNWQQGAMLQWVGATGNLIFNDIKGGRIISRLLAGDGNELFEYPMPVGDINAEGTNALSYSFSKLGKCAPEYGYREISCHPAGGKDLAGEGMWLLPLSDGRPEKLFDLRELAAAAPHKSMAGSNHYFFHGLFSPSGHKFVFFHRWINPKGMLFTRFHASDLAGGQLQTFPVSSASHIAWQNDESILAYCVPLRGRRGYYVFDVESAEHHPLGETFFTSDGHPQFLRGTNCIVTDTYPDKYRLQRLYLFNAHNNKGLELAKLKIPFSFRYGKRCDFHPRWCPDGKKICFDSAHTGVRSLCILPVEEFRRP